MYLHYLFTCTKTKTEAAKESQFFLKNTIAHLTPKHNYQNSFTVLDASIDDIMMFDASSNDA